MLHLNQIIALLNRPGELSRANRSTGIAYNQLWRLAKGRTPNPTYKTIKTLSDHFGTDNEQV
jgi:hypothetical protein